MSDTRSSGVGSIAAAWGLVALLGLGIGCPAFGQGDAVLDERHRPLLESHCVSCHNASDRNGGVRLDDISFAIDTPEQAGLWQKILASLYAGEMPPEGEARPPADAKTELLDHLSLALVAARNRLADSGGSGVMRRLNRREYQNTMRDLLGVEVNASELPADRGTGTFDTVGASLFMSGDQCEQYLAIARHALDDHFQRYASPAESRVVCRLEPETEANPVVDGFVNRSKEIDPIFKVWAAEVERAARAPENAAIMAAITAKDPHSRIPAEGTPPGSHFMLYYHADELPGAPRSADRGLGDTHNASFENQLRIDNLSYFTHYSNLPQRQSGAYLMVAQGYMRIDLKPASPLPAGDYVVRARVAATSDAAGPRRFIEVGAPDPADGLRWDLSSTWSTHQVAGSLESPVTLEIPIRLSATGPQTISLRERQPRGLDVRNNFFYVRKGQSGYGPEPCIWVDWVELEGPLPPREAGGQGVVQLANVRSLDEPAHARDAIQALVARAFRGKPAGQDFLDKLFAFYESRRAESDAHDDALKDTLSIVLASPGFLYLQEIGSSPEPAAAADGPGTKKALSASELASRLSYFLWSGPPDARLAELAASGELTQPDVLAAEVDRMIASEKCDEFIRGFVHQWLAMDRLDFFQFNNYKFREFDEGMKITARAEVYNTFGHLLRSHGSLDRLLKSDEVCINALLATFYGIEGVEGDAFRPVKVPTDSPRGGLLGMAALLAMGGNGDHTSPVERGAWVLRKLMDSPPPPAPPNVPQISRLEGQLLTTRERLAAHMEESQCASCHRKIDPIGFGLENFDAVGKWRTTDSYSKEGVGTREWTIEPAGALHNGPAFADYFELRNLIALQSPAFARGFTKALIEYALGRPSGFSDQQLVDDILARAQQQSLAIDAFIHALVQSPAFTSK